MMNSNRNSQLPISVLNLPPMSNFVEACSPSSQYQLFHVAGKKMCIEVCKVFAPKSKLFSNLEIYQWRNQTEFPIVKTKYVSIEGNNPHSLNVLQLTVYNEHCPLKMNIIYEMTLAQTLYILKQSIIGFQRLLNRFGPFQIKENMIAVNQKGFCRVWINQNFSINSISKPEINQYNMVQTLLGIMYNHCQQSKASRRFFQRLNNCISFLSVLKQIDSFSSKMRVLVPNRFIIMSSLKEIPRSETVLPEKVYNPQNSSSHSIRFSLLSGKNKKSNTEAKQKQHVSQCQNSLDKNNSNSIKRFKSLQRLKVINLMKASDGETAYTRNQKQTKGSNIGIYSSPRQTTNQKTVIQGCKNKKRKWLEESSFVMELEDDKDKDKKLFKEKKEMSYSSAAIKQQRKQKDKGGRKFSANVGSRNGDYYRFNNPTVCNPAKKSHLDYYNNEFNLLLDSQPQIHVSEPKIVEEVDEQRQRDEHTDAIIKNNGWNCITGFLDHDHEEQDLNQSFQQGHDVVHSLNTLPIPQILGSMGRRPVAMSILPQEYEDII